MKLKLFEEFFYEAPEETLDWVTVSQEIEDMYDWTYVESEGLDRIRYDWRNDQLSFWLNSDMTGEGNIPQSIKNQIRNKGVKISLNESVRDITSEELQDEIITCQELLDKIDGKLEANNIYTGRATDEEIKKSCQFSIKLMRQTLSQKKKESQPIK